MIYSVFALLFTFFGVAGIYVLLNADFLAVTQIMIYIGGILVLLIFGVMLTNRITGVDIKSSQTGKLQIIFATLITAGVISTLVLVSINANWLNVPNTKEFASTIENIGTKLLTEYLLAFESASVLLLIAIIGSALISRRK
ncbi:MAG: NADH-quinone oxidoreductase subunit J family protein [Candidatus Kapaibacteriales bacterium]